MALEIKLTRGSSSLALTTLPYQVGLNFAPPMVNMAYNVSSGTSANMTGGGSLIGSRANDRMIEFSVFILASNYSDAANDVRRLASFIKAQSSDPLFLDYRENSDIPVPLWGQFGAPLRMEVVWMDVSSLSSDYLQSLGSGFSVTLSAEIKPLAVGLRQKLVNAMGGIFEDTIGSVDGAARGLAIFEATTNKMTNPVFGASTWSTGWTVSIDVATKNTDTRFTLPGLLQSAKIIATSGNNVVYQTINAGNTNKHSFSAYVMLPDGGTPTGSDVLIWYNTALSTTFQDLGNGLWCAYADNITGINASAFVGVVVLQGRTCYLLGFQMEEKAYHTPLSYGDLLGNSWSGTAHASTSVRAVGNLNQTRDDTLLSMAQGFVSVIWKPYHANTFATAEVLFSLTDVTGGAAVSLRGYFEPAGDVFVLGDGTNTITSAAQIFGGGDVIFLDFAWGPSGLAIYKNGVSIASGATYTPPTAANAVKLFIGNQNSTLPCNGDLLGFDIYATRPTQAQVTALYTAASTIVSGGGRVSTIPWLWTKDGDGVVDNCDDSTRDNWCVAGGVPGSVAAKYAHYVKISNTAKHAFWLGGFDLPEGIFLQPTSHFYGEKSGTADATSSGGEYYGISAGEYLIQSNFLQSRYRMGKQNIFVRLAKSAGSGTIGLGGWFTWGSWGFLNSSLNTKNVAVTTSMSLYYLGSLDIPLISAEVLSRNNFTDVGGSIYFTLGNPVPSFEMNYDFCLIIPGKAVCVSGIANTANTDITNYSGNSEMNSVTISTAGFPLSVNSITGDTLEILPQRYNMLWGIVGAHAEAHVITDTLTLSTDITPRYALL